MRENTMKRIESMGLKAPIAWKDELYRNEFNKLEIQNDMNSSTGLNNFVNGSVFEETNNKFFANSELN